MKIKETELKIVPITIINLNKETEGTKNYQITKLGIFDDNRNFVHKKVTIEYELDNNKFLLDIVNDKTKSVDILITDGSLTTEYDYISISFKDSILRQFVHENVITVVFPNHEIMYLKWSAKDKKYSYYDVENQNLYLIEQETIFKFVDKPKLVYNSLYTEKIYSPRSSRI